MKILIIGINSQDGFYTYKKFLNKTKYITYGTKRIINHQDKKLFNKAKLFRESKLNYLLKNIKFDLIFNFSSINTISKSEKNSDKTFKINGLRVYNILNTIKNKKTKFFQAGSIEQDFFKNKKCDFSYKSTPYSFSKQFAQICVQYFRQKYNLFAVNGILYNHDSHRRRNDFFMKEFKSNLNKWILTRKPFKVYNINLYKDWSHSKDFVDCYIKILNYHEPCDWVIGSGYKYTIRKVCELFFKSSKIKYFKIENKKSINYYELKSKKKIFTGLKTSKKFFHNKKLIKYTQKKLNWHPKINLKQIVNEIYES